MASIKEISERFDISQDTLRYYERIGILPPIQRNASGTRNYDEESANWVEFIKYMRSAGVSIECMIEYVTMFQKGNETIPARKSLLIEQRERIAKRIEEMQSALARLDRKIDGYEERIINCDKKLRRE